MKLEEALSKLTHNTVAYYQINDGSIAIDSDFNYYNFKTNQWAEVPSVDPIRFLKAETWVIRNKASFEHNLRMNKILNDWSGNKNPHNCTAADTLAELLNLLENINPFLEEVQ